MNTVILALIVGLLTCHVVGYAAEALVRHAEGKLPEDVRRRVFARQEARFWLWRTLDFAGFGLMLAGLIAIVLIREKGAWPPVLWRFYAMAGGLVLLCVSQAVRSWVVYAGYAQETGGESARRWARWAAVVVTVTELSLAGAVCAWVYVHINHQTGKTRERVEATPVPGTGDRVISWVSETEACVILGKDKAYLDLIVPWGEARTRMVAGNTFYRRDDLTSLRDAGLPTSEELRDWDARRKAAGNAPSGKAAVPDSVFQERPAAKNEPAKERLEEP